MDIADRAGAPDHPLFDEVRHTTEVDARWLMAFAAAIGDTKAPHLDTNFAQGLVGHPLFSVCVEWPALLASRRGPLGELVKGAQRVVHGGHHVTVHRLIRPGDTLVTSTRVIGIETKRSGVLVHQEFHTVDDSGEPVATTRYEAMAIGAHFSGPDHPPPPHPSRSGPPPPTGVPTVAREAAVVITAGAAHVYTEGSRIYNPIHTDQRAALAAGMEHPILHGTATLAVAASAIVDLTCAGDPSEVEAIGGRFSAPVVPPCILRVRWWPSHEPTIGFRVLGPGDAVVVDGGSLLRRPTRL